MARPGAKGDAVDAWPDGVGRLHPAIEIQPRRNVIPPAKVHRDDDA
ncbi:MAG: hypothetical protein M3144_02135 [Actinomycetota bacterium]|nr:hypothetical protein [Actinomycetota bacterium]